MKPNDNKEIELISNKVELRAKESIRQKNILNDKKKIQLPQRLMYQPK